MTYLPASGTLSLLQIYNNRVADGAPAGKDLKFYIGQGYWKSGLINTFGSPISIQQFYGTQGQGAPGSPGGPPGGK